MRKGWALLHVMEVAREERHRQPATPQEVPEETLEEAYPGWEHRGGSPPPHCWLHTLSSHWPPQDPGVGVGRLLSPPLYMGKSSEVQFSSVTRSCLTLATPWTAARQASLSISNSWSVPKLMCIESMMPSNHLILYRPLLLPPSIFPSIRVFSNESVLCKRWPKYWSFSCSISPSNEYSGLISFKMDWLDLLAVQGTLRSLLQHHSSKAWGIHGGEAEAQSSWITYKSPSW